MNRAHRLLVSLCLLVPLPAVAQDPIFEFVAPSGDMYFEPDNPSSVTKAFDLVIKGDDATETDGFSFSITIPEFAFVTNVVVDSAFDDPFDQGTVDYFVVDTSHGTTDGVTVGCVYETATGTVSTTTFPEDGTVVAQITIRLSNADSPVDGDTVLLEWSPLGDPEVENLLTVDSQDETPTLTNGSINLIAFPDFIRGDVNSNGSVTLSDAVFYLRYHFLAGPEPVCLKSADADDDGNLEGLSEALYLLNMLFSTSSSFPQEEPIDCGQDPTPNDGISCEEATSGC